MLIETVVPVPPSPTAAPPVPRLTRLTRIALEELKLEHLAIVYPG